MSILIDNTGLQAAYQCLEAEARSESDLRGLLQLATLLIFGEKILVNTCSSTPVVQQSEHAMGLLAELGVDDTILDVFHVQPDSFASICDKAAEQSIVPLKNAAWGAKPPADGLAPGIVKGVADDGFYELLLKLEKFFSDGLLNETKSRAFTDSYFGSADYMVANNAELRDLVLGAASNAKWDKMAIERIRVFLRSQLYVEVASRAQAVYAPSISRARLISNNFQLLDSMLRGVDDVVNDFRKVPLEVPSVYAALLKKSRGDPRGIFEETLTLRSQARPIHKEFKRICRNLDLSTPDGRAQASKRIDEVAGDLRKSLEREQRPPLERAIELIGQLVPFRAQESVTKTVDWILSGLRSRRVKVLTNLAWTALDPNDLGEDLRRLEKNSGLH